MQSIQEVEKEINTNKIQWQNTVELVGYIVYDFELSKDANDNNYVSFILGTPSNENPNVIQHHTIKIWNKKAVSFASQFKKYSAVYIQGEIKAYTSNGKTINYILCSKFNPVTPQGDKTVQWQNKASLVGYLAYDVVLNKKDNGESYVNLKIATPSNRNPEKIEYHAVRLWGILAETFAQKFKIASAVHLQGEMKTATANNKTYYFMNCNGYRGAG